MKKKFIGVLAFLIAAAAFFIFADIQELYNAAKYIFTSPQAFRDFIEAQGLWAPLVFFFIQVIQVILSPIPGNITAVAGGAMFGAVKSALLSGFGILTGSIVAFYLARLFGRPLVMRLIGESLFNKYSRLLLGKYTIGLFILFLLPFFPDDALCLLAGLTHMPFPMFLTITVIGRTPGTIFSSLVGAGILNVSMKGWIIIIFLSLIIIFLAVRFGSRIEEWLYKKIAFKGSIKQKQR